MLRSVKELRGYAIRARDGDTGKVDEFFFDDQYWIVRFMVVATGSWLEGKRVLIPSDAFGRPDVEEEVVPVAFTMEQVEKSPEIETHPPVSRQREIEQGRSSNLPMYLMGREMMLPMVFPQLHPVLSPVEEEEETAQGQGDPHLRSTREVLGYGVEAQDGEVGDMDDFLFEERSGRIRQMVVDTGGLLPGKKVLVPTQWIEKVEWSQAKVHVDLSRKAIEHSPEASDLATTVVR
jgi:uncharacterized protein YrrD